MTGSLVTGGNQQVTELFYAVIRMSSISCCYAAYQYDGVLRILFEEVSDCVVLGVTEAMRLIW